MTTNASVNMDARWLRAFADRETQNTIDGVSLPDIARILQIADHIDSMEEKLRWAGDYHQGWLDGRSAQHAHSNVLASHEITPSDGEIIAAALAAGRPITKVPRGVSGLPPEPPYKPKTAAKPKAEPRIHVDLKDL